MTFLDMIEMYNVKVGNDLDNIDSLFTDAQIDERLDKHVLAGVLLDKCGAMRCLYETTTTFKFFSDNFFSKYQWNIKKLVDTVEAEYNPLVNKKLTWTETTDIEQNLDTDEDRSKQNTGTQGNAYSENETNTISAMNSSNYEPDNKRDISGSNTRTDNLNESINASKDETRLVLTYSVYSLLTLHPVFTLISQCEVDDFVCFLQVQTFCTCLILN